MGIPYQLPEFEEAGHPPSFEYPLPLSDEDRAALGDVEPWIGEISGMNVEQASVAWKRRISDGCDPQLLPVSAVFEPYRLTSILEWNGNHWCLCRLPETADREEDIVLCREPADHAVVERVLGQLGICDPAVHEFVSRFTGLREDFPPSGGTFCDPAGQIFQLTEEWMEEACGQAEEWACSLRFFDEWINSIEFFTARSGDILLLRPDGVFAWWPAGDTEVSPFAQSFGEFCEKFVAFSQSRWVYYGSHSRLIPWPFDAHPPDANGTRK